MMPAIAPPPPPDAHRLPPQASQARQFWPLVMLVCVGMLALAACRDPPELVLQNARESLADLNKTACSAKERLPEAIADFSRFVEPKAAKIIALAPEVEKRSTGQFTVFVTCKPPPTIIPDGDVIKVEIGEKRSVVRLKKKSGKGEAEVPLVLVDGHWKLDLLEMESFAKAIQLH